MSQALYRKYRSRSFDEVLGQDHITKTLQKAIKTGRISHAYLFTGPRGVGKTTVARILAREVNDLPYAGEDIHLDVIEIDAASNRRIDEIRDLRERVRIAPAAGKYKVYIIDEVHMLTREAFNALLKTLEEPPAHTIFILATTEAHKLPETIISRTQRFEFKPIAKQQAAKHLQSIAKKEKIQISPEALDLLAEFGNGSFRDSISYLDQLSSAGAKITEADVRAALGLPSSSQIIKLLESLRGGSAKAVLNSLQAVRDQGVDAAAAAAALGRKIRQDIIDGTAPTNWPLLLKKLIEVPASSRPYDYLEISLLETISPGREALDKPEPVADPKTPRKADLKIAADVKTAKPAAKRESFDSGKWSEVVAAAKKRDASIYTALRLALPEYDRDKLTLKFRFPLHQKKLSQAANKEIVGSIIEKVMGSKIPLECVVDKDAFLGVSEAEPAIVPESGSIHSISNIFGSAEVLES